MAEKHSREQVGTLRALLHLARPFKKHFIAIALLALLGTAADLIQPLIYRVAINDVAGLFVHTPQPAAPERHGSAASTPTSSAHKTAEPGDPPEKPKQKHRRGFVAPRTRQQTLTTLLWAVVALFFISVIGHWLSLAADYQSTTVANRIEANLIQSTFGHVLRLPLSFLRVVPAGDWASASTSLTRWPRS
jgi:ABC-type multidrug transport system fused ATPase/permease subunit